MKTTPLTAVDGRFAGLLGQQYAKLLESMPQIIGMEKTIAEYARRGLPRTIKGPRMILDLGCGTGITTLALCQEIDHTHIVGVDKEPTMLDQYQVATCAQKNSLECGITIETVESDALKFLKCCKSQSFDVVVSGYVLHNLPKNLRRKIIQEVGRILRPNGRFVNGDKITRDNQRLHEKDMMDQIRAFVKCYSNPSDVAYGLGWIEHYIRDNQADLKQTESEIRQSLQDAGFEKIRLVKRHGMDAVVVADRSIK